MSARTIKFIAWLWISTLLSATIGVSVHRIYCYCLGKTSVSLFALHDAFAGEKRGQIKSCCSIPKAQKNCCKNTSKHTPEQGCTHKTTKVFQLKTEFTTQEYASEKSTPIEIALVLWAPTLPVNSHFSNALKIGSPPFPQPPPLSGRMICVRHGVFLC